jgi:uncharacterized protein with HEPN domain
MSERDWTFYIEDMIRFASRAREYTEGLDRAGFGARPMVYDATLRNIELLGEAASRIPEAVRQAHPEIPWRLIIATRNRLIHGYLGIDDDVLWSIIQTDLPALLSGLHRLKALKQKDS